VHDHVRARDEVSDAVPVADVAAQLLDRPLELRVVERDDVEGAHVVPVGEQAPRQMKAEEARAP
jgi:hypothetical protein